MYIKAAQRFLSLILQPCVRAKNALVPYSQVCYIFL